MRHQQLLCTFLFLIATLGSFAQARLLQKVDKKHREGIIPYEKYLLPNGLTLIVHEDHSDPVVTVEVAYKVGSGHEEPGKTGFAHFFEHMLFMGSEHLPNGDHMKIITEGGGEANGFTTRDLTAYFQTGPANQLERMLWLEAERMGFAYNAINEQKFELQRAAVKNELGQGFNAPFGMVPRVTLRHLYPYGHPYDHRPGGFLEDLDRATVTDLKHFLLRYYRPNNAIITVGGQVQTKEVVRLVEKYFSSIPSGPEVAPLQVPYTTALEKNRYVSHVDTYTKQAGLQVTYPAVPLGHPDEAALTCFFELFGRGQNSTLYKHGVKTGMASRAEATNNPLDKLTGEINFVLTPMPGKSLADMEKVFWAALDSFEKAGVSDEDVARFKGANEAMLISLLDRVEGKVFMLTAYENRNADPSKFAEVMKQYAGLTKEAVMRAFQKYIRGNNALILSVVPKGGEQGVARPDNYRVDSSLYKPLPFDYSVLTYQRPKDVFDRNKMPGVGRVPVVRAPAYWQQVLPNGLEVIAAPHDELPLVSLILSFPGGHLAQAADPSKAGLAAVFADMMKEGTQKRSADGWTKALHTLGGDINISSGVDDVSFRLRAPKQNLDKVLALLVEKLQYPQFTEEALARIKAIRLQSIKAANTSSTAVADKVFAQLNYGKTSILGIPETGTEETIKAITLADVQAYYSDFISARGAKLVVIGDVQKEALLAQAAAFNVLPQKKVTLQAPAAPVAIKSTKVYLVDMPGSVQTVLRVGAPTGLRYDGAGDFYKATLANYMLGSSFSSRLEATLREKRGWTYTARSSFKGNRYTGTFEVSTSVKGAATDSALQVLMDMLTDYAGKGITDEELAFTKKALPQAEARRYETMVQKRDFLKTVADYNLPPDVLAKRQQVLQSITKAELNKVLAKYLQPHRLNILLVGDKAKMLEGVKKLGFEVVELSKDGLGEETKVL